MSTPYMPLYGGDYLKKTMTLTQGQHGAYLLLLLYHWEEGCLPGDIEECYNIAQANTTQEKNNVDKVIKKYFEFVDEKYINQRNLEERKKYNHIKDVRTKAIQNRYKNPTKNLQKSYKTNEVCSDFEDALVAKSVSLKASVVNSLSERFDVAEKENKKEKKKETPCIVDNEIEKDNIKPLTPLPAPLITDTKPPSPPITTGNLKQIPTKILTLTEELITGILKNDPKNRECQPDKLDKNRLAWAQEIEKLHRIDGRSIDEISAVITFSQTDSFWLANIRSGNALRRNFDQLNLKLKKQGAHNAKRTPGGNTTLNLNRVHAPEGKYDDIGTTIVV